MRFLTGLLVGIALAVLIAALAAAALSNVFSALPLQDEGCAVTDPRGIALDALVDDTGARDAGGGSERTVTYTLDPANLTAGAAALCGTVGDLEVRPSTDGKLRVVFDIRHEGTRSARAVEETDVAAAFAQDQGMLSLSAWRENTVQARVFPFNLRATSVVTSIEVPAGLAFAYDARTNVGKVTLGAVDASSATLRSDVGDVTLSQTRALGDVGAATDVGDVDVALAQARNATLDARSNVGKVTVRLPAGVAYDVRADSDVGKVTLVLGSADVLERDDEGPGDSVHARSSDYATSATQLTVTAATDVGDVTVTRG